MRVRRAITFGACWRVVEEAIIWGAGEVWGG